MLKASYGNGKLYYISTFLWFACQRGGGEGAAELLDRLLEGYKLQTVFCKETGISCWRLLGEEESLLFAFNYSAEKKTAEFSVDLGLPGERLSIKEITEEREVVWACENGLIHFAYPIVPGGAAIFKLSVKKREEG